jgi:hypothetical protein
MEIKLFSTLHVNNLRLDALAGICSETVTFAARSTAALSTPAKSALALLQTNSTALYEAIRRPAKHAKTESIGAKDKQRDNQHAEIKRTVKAGLKSTEPEKVAAAKTLDLFMRPFWNIDKLKIPDQTRGVFSMEERYSADDDGTLRSAAATLGIANLFAAMFEKNKEIEALYNERLSEQVEQSPAASKIKDDVVKVYDIFCTAVQQDINLNPTEELTTLFNHMEHLRTFYAASMRKPGAKKADAKADTKADEKVDESASNDA